VHYTIFHSSAFGGVCTIAAASTRVIISGFWIRAIGLEVPEISLEPQCLRAFGILHDVQRSFRIQVARHNSSFRYINWQLCASSLSPDRKAKRLIIEYLILLATERSLLSKYSQVSLQPSVQPNIIEYSKVASF
jgi:hypothetical protein